MSATTLSFTPDSSGPFTKPNILPLLTTLGLQDANNGIYDTAVPGIALTAITASGAITPGTRAHYVITKSSAAAVMTLAAPTTVTDDGKILWITSSTAQAHTVTATGLFGSGAAATDLATFANKAGAGMAIMAYGAKWLVLFSIGVTFS